MCGRERAVMTAGARLVETQASGRIDEALVQSRVEFLAPLMNSSQRKEYLLWVGLWIIALAFFWAWWINPEHHFSFLNSTATTATLGWVTILPLYFVFIFARSKRMNPEVQLPSGLCVAMVVTKAPSEPFAVIQRTLAAMLVQDYPHDTWLADEDPTPEAIEWCAANNVRISTRKNRADYHRSAWPRRARCKEGNLAFFYDHYGYSQYEFVIQMDADHAPQPGYLREM